MKIMDERGKTREVISIKRVVHQVPDKVHEGVYINVEFVEVTVKGKNMTWKNWMPLDKFKELNPEAEV